MANWTWKDGGFRISGAGTSVLVDISSYVNNQSIQAAITDIDRTGMGAADPVSLNGLSKRTIPLNGFLNSTTEGIFGPIANGTSVAKRFEYKAKASARYYNGSCLPTSIQFSGQPDDQQMFSATLVLTGAWNRTSAALA